MPATRSTNTMSEGLTRILTDIAKMKVEPDADIPFLVGQLEPMILSYLKTPTGNETPTGAPTFDPMGGMGDAMGQVMGVPPQSGGGGAPMGMTSPDELRRMVTA